MLLDSGHDATSMRSCGPRINQLRDVQLPPGRPCRQEGPSSRKALAPGRPCRQEGHDRVGDHIRGSPGQVMARALDELEASIGQGRREPPGGRHRNHGVLGIGEQEHRGTDYCDGVFQPGQLAQQGPNECYRVGFGQTRCLMSVTGSASGRLGAW